MVSYPLLIVGTINFFGQIVYQHELQIVRNLFLYYKISNDEIAPNKLQKGRLVFIIYFVNNICHVLYDTYAKLDILEMKDILYNINGFKA